MGWATALYSVYGSTILPDAFVAGVDFAHLTPWLLPGLLENLLALTALVEMRKRPTSPTAATLNQQVYPIKTKPPASLAGGFLKQQRVA